MNQPAISLAVAAAVVLVGAACGGSGATPTINPVKVLREIGAHVPPGVRVGDTDVFGDRMADGDFYGPGCTAKDNCSEQVTVYTSGVSGTAMPKNESYKENQYSTDSNKVIRGVGFLIFVTGVDDLNCNCTRFYVSPQTIARRAHGHVLPERG